jgi:hypothetical protein
VFVNFIVVSSYKCSSMESTSDVSLFMSFNATAAPNTDDNTDDPEVVEVDPEVVEVTPKIPSRMSITFWTGKNKYCVQGTRRDVMLVKQMTANWPPGAEGKGGSKVIWDNMCILFNTNPEFMANFAGKVSVEALKTRLDDLVMTHKIEIAKEPGLTGCGTDAPMEWVQLRSERSQVRSADRRMNLIHVCKWSVTYLSLCIRLI